MHIKKGKILIFSVSLAFVAAVVFSQCVQFSKTGTDIRGAAYADPKTCIQCHKDIYHSYLHTGHFLTSAPITGNSLPAIIKADSSLFVYNDSVKVRIEKQESGVYQTAYFRNKLKVRQERFDMAFGSGERAQTYGFWKGEQLYELPLSYFSFIHNWAVSPGFPPNQVFYNRAIVTRCLECHTSFAESHYVKSNRVLSVDEAINKNSIVYGVDCQRCHGPAAEHVSFHLKNPGEKQPKFIRTYQSLTRKGKIEMCAVCHSGNDLQVTRSLFLYKPGDTLSHFLEPDFGGAVNEPDVHGNQAKLLAISKCFLSSATMTCITCHNSHSKETGSTAVFSQKCMDCHKTETHNFCKLAPQLGTAITGRCVDCHMPALPSRNITFKMSSANTTSDYLLHTHRIAIYPEKTQEILRLIKKASKKTS